MNCYIQVFNKSKLFLFKKLKSWNVLIIFLSIVLLLSYFIIPYSVDFYGNIHTHGFRWDVPYDEQQKSLLIVKEMSVTTLKVESLPGCKMKIYNQETDEETDETITFPKEDRKYSVQDLKVEGLHHLETKISSTDKMLSLHIEAKKISFIVVNYLSEEKQKPLLYNIKGRKEPIQAKGQYIIINGTSMILVAYLSVDDHGDYTDHNIFSSSFNNIEISPNSMQFVDHYESTILQGKLTAPMRQLQPESTIELSEEDFIKFSPDDKGIMQLNKIILEPKMKPARFLVEVSGKANRIEIRRNSKNTIKDFKFNMLEAILGHEIAKWLMSAAVGGIIISLLTELIRKKIFTNNE